MVLPLNGHLDKITYIHQSHSFTKQLYTYKTRQTYIYKQLSHIAVQEVDHLLTKYL